ncbi:InlB B-repeat-containing protein [Faecalibaculum rodentium]|uniref:InlB B-repeat-containing protein n=1 Tax=Faecalibaculum rodentium TaxID=1702221 RepID=UPI0023F4EB70|nr:InlB B-repeat-containing protein [Faecalibaculum rodentium]
MKSKKNLAATLAFLMTLQATGQPWAVLANEVEDNGPIIGGATDGQTADVLSDDVAIEEPVQKAVTTETEVQAPVEAPATEEAAPAPEETAPVAEAPVEEEEVVPPFADMSEEGSYTARVELVNTDETVSPVTVDMGVIKEKAPNMEAQNYVYKKAAVNGETITAVRTWVSEKEGEKTFCLLENGDVLELTPGMDIVFTYEYVKPVEEEEAEKPENQEETKAPVKVPAKAPADNKPVEEAEPQEPVVDYFAVKFFDQEDKDGKLVKKETPIVTQWIKKGETAVAPAINCPQDYVFTGWSQDVNAAITGDTEFVAQYNKLEKAITLQINFVYQGTSVMVEQPWIADVQPGTYTGTIDFPTVEGCETYVNGDRAGSYTFDKPTEDTVINVEYKGVETAYMVKHIFLNASGQVNTDKKAVEETLKGGINTPTNAQAKEFAGYTVKTINNVTIKGEGTVAEVRYAPTAFTITYQTGDGGSYVAPQSVYVDAHIPSVDEPKKLGYTFDGWTYEGVNGTLMPARDVVAVAKWKANTQATYTVNYWQEGINGGYELAQTGGKPDVVTETGTVGETISYTAENERYAGFHLNTEESAGDVEITADGQAVKNVYYDRNEYSIKFMVPSGWNKYSEDTSRRITAKYGVDISQEWTKNAEGYSWKVAPNSSTNYTAFTNMPLDGITCYQGKQTGNYLVNYYVETLNSNEYKRLQSIESAYYTNLTKEDQQPIDGFTYSSWKLSPGDYIGFGTNDSGHNYQRSAWLKYTRNSYALQFNNCAPIASASVKFEAPIGNYLPKASEVTPPATEDSDSVFAGWYTAPVGGEKIDPDATMPSHVVQVYAHWEKAKYDVSYETNRDGLTYPVETLEKGSVITTPEVTEEGFLGWYTDPSFEHAFVEGTQIGGDTTLYARWDSDNQTTYSIKYVDEDGKELKVTDNAGSIEVGTTAQITAESTIIVDGKSYYPTETVKTLMASQKAEENVVVFTCKPIQSWSYTVKYVDADGNEIHASKTVQDVHNTLIQERAISIEGYQLTGDPIQTLSVSDSKKEIIFRYAATTASYQVQYIGLEEDGTKKVLEDADTFTAEVGDYVTAEPKTFLDYERVTEGKALSAAVRADGKTVIQIFYRHCEHKVTYTLDAASQKLYEGAIPAEGQYRTGATVTVADGLTLDGYTFTGWKLDNKTVSGSFNMPKKDVILVGSFKRDLSNVTVDEIAKTYNGATSSLTVNGLKTGDTVTFWSGDGKEELNNSFKNVFDSQEKVLVKVRSADGQDRVLETFVKIAPAKVTMTSGSSEKHYDGSALTNSTVNAEGFVTGEGATYNCSGSQTIPGSSKNTFTYTLNKGTDKRNYNIATKEGTLTVTDVEDSKRATFEVKAKSLTTKYDGTTKTVSGLEATEFTWNGHTYRVEGLTASASGKDAGKYDSIVSGTAVVKDADDKDVTKQFTVTSKNGTLTIEKRNVVLTSEKAGKVYDGTPLTAKEVKVSGDGFVGEEGAVYDVTGTITAPGTVDNEFSYKLKSNTKADNYVIKTETGTLTVTSIDDDKKFEVTVTAASDEKTYNGQNQTVEGLNGTEFEWNKQKYTISGLEARVTGKDADSYTNEVIGTAVIKDAAGNNVTDQFKLNRVNGQLKINPRKVTLTSATDSKDYDGSPLKNSDVSVSGDGFVTGEGATYDVKGSITLPGTVDNEFTYVLNDGTKSENYTITPDYGKLTINDRKEADKEKDKVTVKANSDTVTYDGAEHEVSGLDKDSFVWKGLTYTIEGLTASASGTDAETYSNKVVGTAVVRDAAGNDVTKQFKVETSDGALIINKRDVTLTSATDKKEYDGSALTNDTVTAAGFVEGEGADYTVTGSITLPGTTKNTFSYTLKSNTRADNYNVTKEEGDLTVTDVAEANKHVAIVKAENANAKYDGNTHTVSGVTGTTFEWKGHTYTIEGLDAEAEGKDADTYDNIVRGTAVVLDENRNDVTKQFTVKTENGKLTIAKRVLTLTSADDKKVYDGYALGNENVFLTGDEFVEGEKPAYVFGKDTKPVEVGTYSNDFTCEFAKDVNADNYDITIQPGTLIIEQAEPTIVVNADGSEIAAEGILKKYDGETVTVSATASSQEGKPIDGNFTYTVKNLETGEEYTSKEAPAFTNSGKWEVTATTDNENCKETSKTVTVEILKRNVLLVSEDQEWVYDGTEHKHEKAYVHESGDGFVKGEEPEFHSFASIMDAGTTENTFSYRFSKRSGATTLSRVARFLGIASEDPDNIAANYNIEVQHGTLKVKKADAKHHNLTLADKTVTYNGKYQMLDAATSDIKDAKIQYSVDGQTWTDELPAFTHVGKYTVKARAMHNNYEDAETSAVLEVVPAKLTVTTESAEKVYDGKALTAGGSVTGLAEGDEVELLLTGSQTEVGESANTYELKWTKADAADYEVTEAIGTLKVTPKPAEPAEPEAPKKDETPEAPEKSDARKPNKVVTALGLDPALWTSIMGAAGLGMIGAAHLSRRDKKKKDEE